MWSILLLPVLSLFAAVVADPTDADRCFHEYPTNYTAAIVEKLVKKYSIESARTDADGIEWLNLLLLENGEGYELDGLTYYVNPNDCSPETCHYFTWQPYVQTPTFVVPKSMVNEWKAGISDETYSLNKIKLNCGAGKRLCGLRCCSTDYAAVIQEFNDNVAVNPMETVAEWKGITYSLIEPREPNANPNTSCSYQASKKDGLHFIEITKELTIHFRCPEFSNCCGLSCEMSPRALKAMIDQETILSASQKERLPIVGLQVGTGLLLAAFLSVIALMVRRRNHARELVEDECSNRDSISLPRPVDLEGRLTHQRQTEDTMVEMSPLIENVDLLQLSPV